MRTATIRCPFTGIIDTISRYPFLFFCFALVFFWGGVAVFCSITIIWVCVCVVTTILIFISTAKEANAISSNPPILTLGFDLNKPEFAAIANVLAMQGTQVGYFNNLCCFKFDHDEICYDAIIRTVSLDFKWQLCKPLSCPKSGVYSATPSAFRICGKTFVSHLRRAACTRSYPSVE